MCFHSDGDYLSDSKSKGLLFTPSQQSYDKDEFLFDDRFIPSRRLTQELEISQEIFCKENKF